MSSNVFDYAIGFCVNIYAFMLLIKLLIALNRRARTISFMCVGACMETYEHTCQVTLTFHPNLHTYSLLGFGVNIYAFHAFV